MAKRIIERNEPKGEEAKEAKMTPAQRRKVEQQEAMGLKRGGSVRRKK